MRIALHSALTNSGRLDAVLAEVRRTAEHGLAGYWAAMLTGHDTLTVLALAGQAVPGIELGTAVVPIPLRSPFALAQQVATVQAAVDGRLVLGIGTSHETFVRNRFSEPWGPPVATARTYLDDLRRIMAGPIMGGDDDQRIVTARHRTPVLLGAVNPAMIGLAVECASGVVTWAAGPKTIGLVVNRAHGFRADGEAFRGHAFRIVASLPVWVTDDEDAARREIQARLGANDQLPSYQKVLQREGVAGVHELSLVGSPERVWAQLDRLEESGVTDFAAHPVTGPGRDDDRTWELLAERAAR